MVKTLFFRLFLIALLFTSSLSAQELTLRDVLRLYSRALGDLVEMRNLRSIRTKGTTRQQSQSYDFIFYKKAPNLIRYELLKGGKNYVQAFDGNAGWQWSPDNKKAGAIALSEQQLAFLAKEAKFEPPLLTYQRDGRICRFLGERTIRRHPNPVLLLRLTDPLNEAVDDIYLDSVTYYQVAHQHKPNPESVPLETTFQDYRKIKGFPIPFEIKSYYGEELISETKLTEAAVNVGILSFYFQKPGLIEARAK